MGSADLFKFEDSLVASGKYLALRVNNTSKLCIADTFSTINDLEKVKHNQPLHLFTGVAFVKGASEINQSFEKLNKQ